MDSCNGINTPNGGDWGLFGAATSKGDPVTSGFFVSMTNCNVEDFNSYGLRFRGSGYAKISGGAVQAKATGSYGAEFYIEYTNGLIIIENVAIAPQGATRTKKAPIYMDADSYVYVIGAPTTPVTYDVAGSVYSLPRIISSYPQPFQRAINVNNLDVAQFYNRYAGTAVLSGGSATVTFGNPQIDTNYRVLVTGNVTEAFAVTNKTTSGFVIASNNAASSARVDWMACRTGT